MIKKLLLVLGLVSLLVMPMAFSQQAGKSPESAKSIVISGGLDFELMVKDKTLNQLASATYDGTNFQLGREKADTFINGSFFLKFDAQLAENVSAVLKLANYSYESTVNPTTGAFSFGTYADVFGSSNLPDVYLTEGYLKLEKFLTSNATLVVGWQNVAYDLRGNGNAFLLDTAHTANPYWRSVKSAEGFPFPQPGFLPNAPGGFKLTYSDNKTYALDFFTLQLSETRTATTTADNFIWGLVFDYSLSEKNMLTVKLIDFAYDDFSANLYTIGGGVDYFVKDNLELYGEAYLQTGDYFGILDATGDKLNQKAWAGYIGGKYVFSGSELKPYIDLSYWYFSGDKDTLAENISSGDDQETFVTAGYLEKGALILENGYYGLEATGYWAAKIEGGITTKLNKPNDFEAKLLYGWFKANKKTNALDKDLGSEIDLRLNWNYTESVSLGFAAGFLFGSDRIEESLTTLGGKKNDRAQLYLITTKIRF